MLASIIVIRVPCANFTRVLGTPSLCRCCSAATDAQPAPSTRSKHRPLSASSRAQIQRMIRVNHAGEFGADRIYAGQMAVLG